MILHKEQVSLAICCRYFQSFWTAYTEFADKKTANNEGCLLQTQLWIFAVQNGEKAEHKLKIPTNCFNEVFTSNVKWKSLNVITG